MKEKEEEDCFLQLHCKLFCIAFSCNEYAQPGAYLSVFIGADQEMINKYPRMNQLDMILQKAKVWLHKPNKNNFTPVSALAFQIKKKHVEAEPLT